MSGPTLQAQIDAAIAYEAVFVPALFGQWALKVSNAAQIQPGQRVLDVAFGTGILARGVILTEDQIGHILQEAEHALGSYATRDGRVSFRVSAHLVTARKPQYVARCAV